MGFVFSTHSKTKGSEGDTKYMDAVICIPPYKTVFIDQIITDSLDVEVDDLKSFISRGSCKSIELTP